MKELTSVQIEFIKILEAFMHDKQYSFPEDFVQLVELYQLASVHHMASAIYNQTYKEEIFNKPEYRGLAQIFKQQTIRSVMMQTQKTECFKRLYGKLREAGVKPLVVKGLICRNLYTKSDYRISGDEDILLRREEFEECDRILLAEGFQREELNMEQLPHEIPYFQPQSGVYIELHFTLFPEESGAYGHLNREFTHVFGNSISENVQGTDICTLSPTDHMFYLICHSFKHFLHGGFGLRQVCDMVKMEAYYGEKIEWHDIGEKLIRLHMDTYWNALVEIGEKYLGASWKEACVIGETQENRVDSHELLLDLLESGIYGDSSMERKHSSNMTLAAVKSGKKDVTASIAASLFPSMEYMKGKYSWLNKCPWLLPAAWAMRIVNYVKTSRKRDEKENSVEIGMNRVELLRKYNIID